MEETQAVTSPFKGIEDVHIIERLPKILDEGEFTATLGETQIITTRKWGPLYLMEMTIDNVVSGPYQKGERRAFSIYVSKDQFLTYARMATGAALNISPNTVTEAMSDEFISEKQPGKGKKIKIVARVVPADEAPNGHAYTKWNFSPVVTAAS
jgi:hypothetical protein